MKNQNEIGGWQDRLVNMKERLQKPYYWYPYPALLAVGLVFILNGHLFPGLNPRYGSPVGVTNLSAKQQKEGSIWIGVYPVGEKVIAITAERKYFQWPLKDPKAEHIQDFIKYLKERAHREIVATGLSLDANLTKIAAVIAVDERLQYGHLRPVLQALAAAKISRYGFETKILDHES